MTGVAVQSLSPRTARTLTDEVKRDAESLWQKLVDLYEGGAHVALGYSSWGKYFEVEFGGSDATAYRLLQSGRALAQLPMGSPRPTNERQARELAPLLEEPDQLREAWAEVVALHPEPTAAQVREVVEKLRPRISVPLNEELLAKQQRETLISHLDHAIYSLEGPPSMATAEAKRLLVDGDAGPFTPSRFERVIAYATAFANALREAGIDG